MSYIFEYSGYALVFFSLLEFLRHPEEALIMLAIGTGFIIGAYISRKN